MGITGDLAHYITQAKFDDLPADVVKLAKQLILDQISCAFGGYPTPEAKLFVDYVKNIGGKPEVTILGDGEKVPCAHGAGVNAVMGNVLDFDDTCQNKLHPGSMIVWSAISMAERQEASGRDLINSVVVGYEITARIFNATKPSAEFKNRYTTHNSDTFGSMVAAAKILKLDEERVNQAFGIAGHTAPMVNMSTAIRENPALSPIKAAVYWQSKTGTEAALLAGNGFIGPADTFDKRDDYYGYWPGVSDKCDWNALTEKLGEEYLLARYLSFKPWPTCRHIQAGIEMLTDILREKGLTAEDTKEIIWGVTNYTASQESFHEPLPRDRHGKMFSVPWAFTMTALGYPPGRDWQSDEKMNEPKVRELVKKIKMEADPEVNRKSSESPEKFPTKITVRAKGDTYERQNEYIKGDRQRPMTAEETKEKFWNQVQGIISSKEAERILEIADHLEELDNIAKLTKQFKSTEV